MSENAISTGIMSTASIITTIVIIVAGFVVAGSIGASINRSGENLADQMDTEIDILTIGSVQSGQTNFSVFIKNNGDVNLASFQFIDVFLDGDYYYLDSVDTSQYRWNATILNDNGNNILDIYETARLHLSLPLGDSLSAGMHKLTLSIKGQTEDYTFSL